MWTAKAYREIATRDFPECQRFDRQRWVEQRAVSGVPCFDQKAACDRASKEPVLGVRDVDRLLRQRSRIGSRLDTGGPGCLYR